MIEREEEHFVGLVAQKAIIERDGKWLMVKNHRDTTWDFPGGRLNLDEDAKTGLVRELHEELGINAVLHKVVYVNQYFHQSAGKQCLFIIYTASFDGEVCLAEDELTAWDWIDPNTLSEQNTFKTCLDTLAAYRGM